MLEPDRRIGGRWIDHAVVPDQVDHDQRQGNSRQGSATKPAIAVGGEEGQRRQDEDNRQGKAAGGDLDLLHQAFGLGLVQK